MARSDPPFFIVGSARSGTTFLRLTLNAHPEIAVPPESRFITELHKGQGDVEVMSFLAKLQGHPRFEAWELPIDVVVREFHGTQRVPYATAIRSTYNAYAAHHGKSRWGDKTPRYILNIPELAKLFGDARFIHLIRDGRDVALSYADVPFGPKNVAKAAEIWAARVGAGIRDGRALEPGRYLEVLYSDLVEDNEGEIKDITEFIGVDFDPAMLDPDAAKQGVLARAERYNPNVTEKAIRRVRDWQTEMPADQVEVFEVIAGDVLSELGFERRFPEPSRKARLKAKAGLRGLPVGKLPSRAG
ncbi:MAG: hypothetical protein QOG54_2042 [Actinomycetota bacterium]|nr:hypothetical protein [Actinomycetota bacterium]